MGQACLKAKAGGDQLSQKCTKKVHEAFDSFDIDRSKAIDMQEALRHWTSKGGKFGKLSAQEFFNAVDMDKNGEIEFDEFQRFWQVVKQAGHSEKDIMEELERIKNGESWVGFNNLPIQHHSKSIRHNQPKEGATKQNPEDN